MCPQKNPYNAWFIYPKHSQSFFWDAEKINNLKLPKVCAPDFEGLVAKVKIYFGNQNDMFFVLHKTIIWKETIQKDPKESQKSRKHKKHIQVNGVRIQSAEVL